MDRDKRWHFGISAGLVFCLYAILTIPKPFRKRFLLDHRLFLSGVGTVLIGLGKEIADTTHFDDFFPWCSTPNSCQGFSIWDLLTDINGATTAVLFLMIGNVIYEKWIRVHPLLPPCDSTVASTILNEDVEEYDNQQQQVQQQQAQQQQKDDNDSDDNEDEDEEMGDCQVAMMVLEEPYEEKKDSINTATDVQFDNLSKRQPQQQEVMIISSSDTDEVTNHHNLDMHVQEIDNEHDDHDDHDHDERNDNDCNSPNDDANNQIEN